MESDSSTADIEVIDDVETIRAMDAAYGLMMVSSSSPREPRAPAAVKSCPATKSKPLRQYGVKPAPAAKDAPTDVASVKARIRQTVQNFKAEFPPKAAPVKTPAKAPPAKAPPAKAPAKAPATISPPRQPPAVKPQTTAPNQVQENVEMRKRMDAAFIASLQYTGRPSWAVGMTSSLEESFCGTKKRDSTDAAAVADPVPKRVRMGRLVPRETFVYRFPEPVMPVVRAPIEVEIFAAPKTPEEREHQTFEWLPFALWAAIIPWSGLSITIPVIEDGHMKGLLLDLQEFQWMFCKLAGLPVLPDNVQPFPEETLRRMFRETGEFRRWQTISDPDRVVVVLEERHFNAVKELQYTRPVASSLAHNTMRARFSFDELGTLDLRVQRKAGLSRCEEGIHRLLLSIDRRWACRTTWEDFNHDEKWTSIPAGLHGERTNFSIEKELKQIARMHHVAKEVNEDEIDRVVRSCVCFGYTFDRTRRLMPVRL